MILFELLWGFLKVGCFSFGGAYAAIPLIRDVVLEYGWIDDEMLAYMIAVSESSPGPIMINMATYIGASQAGIAGAIVATLAVTFPAFVIVLLIASVMSKVVKNKYVEAALSGIIPCIIGIIMATGIFMIVSNVTTDAERGLNYLTLAFTAVLAILYYGVRALFKKNMSPILFIVISAVLGAMTFSIM